MPTFNIAEGKLSIHHSLKINANTHLLKNLKDTGKGWAFRAWLLGGGHRGIQARKLSLREGKKGMGKSTKPEKVTL